LRATLTRSKTSQGCFELRRRTGVTRHQLAIIFTVDQEQMSSPGFCGALRSVALCMTGNPYETPRLTENVVPKRDARSAIEFKVRLAVATFAGAFAGFVAGFRMFHMPFPFGTDGIENAAIAGCTLLGAATAFKFTSALHRKRRPEAGSDNRPSLARCVGRVVRHVLISRK
jgi:hypothetical protein